MAQLVRFGVSLEKGLLEAFDKRSRAKKYTNRSQALSDLIREDLGKIACEDNGEVAGAVVLIYDHHKRELVNKLMDIQHDFGSLIMSSQHVHLDHHHCLEIVAVKGNAQQARQLADSLKAVKGIKHATLAISGMTGNAK